MIKLSNTDLTRQPNATNLKPKGLNKNVANLFILKIIYFKNNLFRVKLVIEI